MSFGRLDAAGAVRPQLVVGAAHAVMGGPADPFAAFRAVAGHARGSGDGELVARAALVVVTLFVGCEKIELNILF